MAEPFDEFRSGVEARLADLEAEYNYTNDVMGPNPPESAPEKTIGVAAFAGVMERYRIHLERAATHREERLKLLDAIEESISDLNGAADRFDGQSEEIRGLLARLTAREWAAGNIECAPASEQQSGTDHDDSSVANSDPGGRQSLSPEAELEWLEARAEYEEANFDPVAYEEAREAYWEEEAEMRAGLIESWYKELCDARGIHTQDEEPPQDFQHTVTLEDGTTVGSLIGTKTELGHALHNEDGLTQEGYRKTFNSSQVKRPGLWVRETPARDKLEVFFRSPGQLRKARARLAEKSTKGQATTKQIDYEAANRTERNSGELDGTAFGASPDSVSKAPK